MLKKRGHWKKKRGRIRFGKGKVVAVEVRSVEVEANMLTNGLPFRGTSHGVLSELIDVFSHSQGLPQFSLFCAQNPQDYEVCTRTWEDAQQQVCAMTTCVRRIRHANAAHWQVRRPSLFCYSHCSLTHTNTASCRCKRV